MPSKASTTACTADAIFSYIRCSLALVGLIANSTMSSYVDPSDGWHNNTNNVPSMISHPSGAGGAAEVVSKPAPQNTYDGYNDYEDPWIPNNGQHNVPPPYNAGTATNNLAAAEQTNEPPAPPCHCGEPSKRLVSTTARNPNRAFFKCNKFKDDPTACKFFAWEDELVMVNGQLQKPPGSSSPQKPPPATRRRFDTDQQPGNQYALPYTKERFVGGDYVQKVAAPTLQGGAGGQWQPPELGGGGSSYQQQQQQNSGYPSAPGSYQDGGGAPAKGACFKCGSFDHWARDCTQGRQSPAKGGYNSQQPSGNGYGYNGGQNGYGGDNGAPKAGNCYKCGESGHWASNCKNAGKPTGGYGGGGGGGTNSNFTCYKCGEVGHYSRSCPNANAGGGAGGFNGTKRKWDGYNNGGGGGGWNNNYGGGGRGAGGGGGAVKKGGCFHCGKSDHWSSQCPFS